MRWVRTMSRYSRTGSATAWNKETHVPGLTARAIAASCLLGSLAGPVGAQSIYTCIDSHGRHITADRPIRECLDREQKELNASGTVKRSIGPSLTAEERAAAEEKARRATEESNRLVEEKKRERALLARYPDRKAHDRERLEALDRVDQAIAAARDSVVELVAARRRLDVQLEFYRKDPSKIPVKLERQIEENDGHRQAQQRFVDNQDSEKRRINAQFDHELAQLRQLWTQSTLPVKAADGPSAVKRSARGEPQGVR
jgi:hypothetical protein